MCLSGFTEAERGCRELRHRPGTGQVHPGRREWGDPGREQQGPGRTVYHAVLQVTDLRMTGLKVTDPSFFCHGPVMWAGYTDSKRKTMQEEQ